MILLNPPSVRYIVIHCSATPEDCPYSVEQLRSDHRKKGFPEIGYHFYVRRSGEIVPCRSIIFQGAHVRHHNQESVAICYEGGLSSSPTPPQLLPCIGEVAEGRRGIKGKRNLVPADTRTEAQQSSLIHLIRYLKQFYPQARVQGHRDFPGVAKECPCFDAKAEYLALK